MKAFNKVLRKKLWDKTRNIGYPEHLIRPEEIYEDTTMYLHIHKMIIMLKIRNDKPRHKAGMSYASNPS
jgi:hypothetical protein